VHRRRAEHGRLRRLDPRPGVGWGAMTDQAASFMKRALELAERGWGRVSPNPMVGAVLVRGGSIVGEGWHEGPGSRHAEVMALDAAGEAARGATVFVTLEPCDHTGRTGPCTAALARAGVRRVVAAAGDPNPVVGGRGYTQLRASGIEVETGILEAEAHALNRAFERHVVTGLPSVTLKMASSLDGKAAAADGSSRWITGPAARSDVQRLRAWADAVVVGAGTALADDPSLTVREQQWTQTRPPLRVVVDAAGRVPPSGRLFDGAAPTLVATTDLTPEPRVRSWTEAGAEVLALDRGPGGVSLPALARALGKRDVQAVLVEGGPTLAWSFVEAALVDRIVVYLAPVLLGGATAPGVLMGTGFTPVGEALGVEVTSVERMGDDWKVEADVYGDRRREG
jgi:diaminohydroxyphosphoribosylaminopyrimidine deaminase / 5-amino-6-(5-phosphoribosylamino)uracil reductase